MHDDQELFDRHRETPVRWQSSKDTDTDDRNLPSPWKDGDSLGQFVLETMLGAGSSAWVYRALDTETDKLCVLKVLKPNNSESLLRNRIGFRRMLTIEHPNLVKADRIYQIDNYTALRMREVVGTTFASGITTIAKQDPKNAFDILLSLLRDYATGLAVLHAYGLVHRDIKPHNLMIDQDNRGVIVDYGMVDFFELNDRPTNATGPFIPTVRYGAPEAICNQRYLPAGDVFSLGLVIADSLRILARYASPAAANETAIEKQIADDESEEQFQSSFQETSVDTELILESLGDLKLVVPDLIRNACTEMLDRHTSERPTAMRLARLGLPPASQVPWIDEDPIFGRQKELGQIAEWADGVFEGNVSRLHITGPSGIGKSRLLTEVVNTIESRRWVQVFSAKCGAREDAPYQAFAQICDMIGHRYRREDREKMRLKPASANFLCQAFPVLDAVIARVDHYDPTPVQQLTREETLEAGAQMSEQLREMGPMFLIIDDVQWADRDSLNVLDRLQVAAGKHGMGIITVSREPKDSQRRSANVTIPLQKLSIETAVEMLRTAAQRHGLVVPEEQLYRYAESADGSAFRLKELADELAPTGMLHWLFLPKLDDPSIDTSDEINLSHFGSIDQFWRRRVDMLSDDAKALLPLIAAGGYSSTRQLTDLSGLGDAVDAAISELAKARLIVDDATGGECVSILHDSVAEQLVASLPDRVKREASAKWAELLIKQDKPELSARIAGHLFAAKRPKQAVHFAIAAAEEAERLVALTEAARWYSIAAEHTDGEEQVELVRRTARHYHSADRPAIASRYYSQLSKLVSGQEKDECERLSVALSIRSGHFLSVRDQLDQLAKRLRLPRPKSSIVSMMSIAVRVAKLAWKRRHRRSSGIEVRDVTKAFGIGKEHVALSELSAEDALQRKRLEVCNQLARPMSLFDSLYSAELNVTAANLVSDYGDDAQRIHVAVGESVYGCYEPGNARNEGEAVLLALSQHVCPEHQPKSQADVWSGIACAHTLSCRWDQVHSPLRMAVDAYQSLSSDCSFELAHSQWMGLWSNWHIGRWQKLMTDGETMIADATKRGDLYMQMLTTGGFGAASWLSGDRVEELQHAMQANEQSQFNNRQMEFFQVFQWMADLQRECYLGDFESAWQTFRSSEPALCRYPFRKIQMIRIVRASFGSLIALHRMAAGDLAVWSQQVKARTRQLRQENSVFADVVADLHDGLMYERLSRINGKSAHLARAIGLLTRAARRGGQHRLRPYELAAQDALSRIQSQSADAKTDEESQPEPAKQLFDRMRRHGVVCPEKLARLYTVDPEAIR